MAVAEHQEPHIALLGGGYVLQRVAERLAPSSFVITSRSAQTCAAWQGAGWNSQQVSFADPASIAALIARYPTVRYFVDSVPPLSSEEDPALGVKNLCRAIKDIKNARVIYLSTTGVFGVRDGSIVNEETLAAPWNAQGRARLLSENAYRASGVHCTALRLPAIYGPERGIVSSLRNGSYSLPSSGAGWTNRIHVDDLAMIIERALSIPSLPPVLCVADDCPAQALEVVRFVCAREGLPVPKSVPEEELLKGGAFTLLSNQRVDNTALKKALGITLRYPSYREGLYS